MCVPMCSAVEKSLFSSLKHQGQYEYTTPISLSNPRHLIPLPHTPANVEVLRLLFGPPPPYRFEFWGSTPWQIVGIACYDCAKSLQGKHLLAVQYRQPGPDVPVTCPPPPCPPMQLYPPAWLCAPCGFVHPLFVVSFFRQSTRSLAGQLATRVPRGNLCYSGLRTAVALSTASRFLLSKRDLHH